MIDSCGKLQALRGLPNNLHAAVMLELQRALKRISVDAPLAAHAHTLQEDLRDPTAAAPKPNKCDLVDRETTLSSHGVVALQFLDIYAACLFLASGHYCITLKRFLRGLVTAAVACEAQLDHLQRLFPDGSRRLQHAFFKMASSEQVFCNKIKALLPGVLPNERATATLQKALAVAETSLGGLSKRHNAGEWYHPLRVDHQVTNRGAAKTDSARDLAKILRNCSVFAPHIKTPSLADGVFIGGKRECKGSDSLGAVLPLPLSLNNIQASLGHAGGRRPPTLADSKASEQASAQVRYASQRHGHRVAAPRG